MPVLRTDGTDVLVEVYLQPRASRTRVAGEHDGRLKIQVAAPPVDGEANAALLEAMAGWLGLPKSRVALESGASSRRKTVRIQGLSLEDASRLLAH